MEDNQNGRRQNFGPKNFQPYFRGEGGSMVKNKLGVFMPPMHMNCFGPESSKLGGGVILSQPSQDKPSFSLLSQPIQAQV